MPPPTNGELRDRVRELEAELDRCENLDPERGRVRELEGLLAGCTRQLEQCQRELAEALDALEQQPLSELAEVQQPAHLAALEGAIAALAGAIRDAEGDAFGELFEMPDRDAGETRLVMMARSVQTLAQAHQMVTPKPLPPITRQGHVIG